MSGNFTLSKNGVLFEILNYIRVIRVSFVFIVFLIDSIYFIVLIVFLRYRSVLIFSTTAKLCCKREIFNRR